MGEDVKLVTSSSEDHRSYHISSEKITKEVGFVPKYTICEAIEDLKQAFDHGKFPNSLTDERYYNIKRIQSITLV